jgi:hypothetical protein
VHKTKKKIEARQMQKKIDREKKEEREDAKGEDELG